MKEEQKKLSGHKLLDKFNMKEEQKELSGHKLLDKFSTDDIWYKNREINCYNDIISAMKSLDKLFKERNRQEDERNIPLNLFEIQKYEFLLKNAEDIICRIATNAALNKKHRENESDACQ